MSCKFVFASVMFRLHGLGFESSWRTYIEQSKPVSDLTKYEFISPKFKFNYPNERDVTVDGLNPLIIFDKFMYQTNKSESLSTYYDRMNITELTEKGQNFTDWIKIFKEKVGEDASKLYGLMTTSNYLEFRTKGNNLTLQSEYPYREGSSISHADQRKYKNTSIFMMTPNAKNGTSVEELIKKYGTLIDEIYLDVLKTIGYSIY